MPIKFPVWISSDAVDHIAFRFSHDSGHWKIEGTIAPRLLTRMLSTDEHAHGVRNLSTAPALKPSKPLIVPNPAPKKVESGEEVGTPRPIFENNCLRWSVEYAANAILMHMRYTVV